MLTLDSLKTALDIAVDDPSQDSYLNTLIDASITLMESYAGKTLRASDITETLSGTDSRIIALTHYPIITLTKAEDLAAGSDITALLAVENGGATGTVRFIDRSGWFYPERFYDFNYRAGYETLPSDLVYAQQLLAQHLYYQADRVKGGVQSVVTPDGSYVYDTNIIPVQVQQILNRYRKHYF